MERRRSNVTLALAVLAVIPLVILVRIWSGPAARPTPTASRTPSIISPKAAAELVDYQARVDSALLATDKRIEVSLKDRESRMQEEGQRLLGQDPRSILPGGSFRGLVVGKSAPEDVLAILGSDCYLHEVKGNVIDIRYDRDSLGTHRRPEPRDLPNFSFRRGVLSRISVGRGQVGLRTPGGTSVRSTREHVLAEFGPEFSRRVHGSHEALAYPCGIEFAFFKSGGVAIDLVRGDGDSYRLRRKAATAEESLAVSKCRALLSSRDATRADLVDQIRTYPTLRASLLLRLLRSLAVEDQVGQYRAVVTSRPSSLAAALALERIHEIAFAQAERLGTVSGYDAFVALYPWSNQSEMAEERGLELAALTRLPTPTSGQEGVEARKALELLSRRSAELGLHSIARRCDRLLLRRGVSPETLRSDAVAAEENQGLSNATDRKGRARYRALVEAFVRGAGANQPPDGELECGIAKQVEIEQLSMRQLRQLSDSSTQTRGGFQMVYESQFFEVDHQLVNALRGE
jgi:hypothetical protein